jgi:hypothetical protein
VELFATKLWVANLDAVGNLSGGIPTVSSTQTACSLRLTIAAGTGVLMHCHATKWKMKVDPPRIRVGRTRHGARGLIHFSA